MTRTEFSHTHNKSISSWNSPWSTHAYIKKKTVSAFVSSAKKRYIIKFAIDAVNLDPFFQFLCCTRNLHMSLHRARLHTKFSLTVLLFSPFLFTLHSYANRKKSANAVKFEYDFTPMNHTTMVLTSWFTYAPDPQRYVIVPKKINYIFNLYVTATFYRVPVIVFHDSLSQTFTDQYSNTWVSFKRVTPDKSYSINDFRFIVYENFLRKHKIDFVLMIDASDVFFNENPFPYIINNKQKLLASHDSGTFHKKSWNVENCYGASATSWSGKSLPMYNAGVWGGRSEIVQCVLKCISRQLMGPLRRKGNCNMPAYNWCIHYGPCNATTVLIEPSALINPFRKDCRSPYSIIHNKCKTTEGKTCATIVGNKVRLRSKTSTGCHVSETQHSALHIEKKVYNAPSMVHVVYAADRSAVPGVIASIKSVRRFASMPVTFYFVGESPLESVSDVHFVSLKTVNTKFRLWQYSNQKLKGKMSSLKSPANYVRFVLADLFPKLSKVLWIDADTIVNCDIVDMVQQALTTTNYAIAAVPRRGRPAGLRPTFETSISTSFNAGVTVIDLDRWRNQNITQKIKSWVDRNTAEEIYSFGSQPPMALVIGENFERLDKKWNVDGLGWRSNRPIPADSCILHWSGSQKHWHPDGLNKKMAQDKHRGWHQICETRIKPQISNSITAYQWADKHTVKGMINSLFPKLRYAKEYAAVDAGSKIVPSLINNLPNEYMMKATHMSGGIVMVQGGRARCLRSPCSKQLNTETLMLYLRRMCNIFLTTQYGADKGELWYTKITPRCIFEELFPEAMSKEFADYKVWTIHGNPIFVEVDQNRFDRHTRTFVTPTFERINMTEQGSYYYPPNHALTKPSFFSDLISNATALARAVNESFARVNFFAFLGTFAFSEITFAHDSCKRGKSTFTPAAVEEYLGNVQLVPGYSVNNAFPGVARRQKRGTTKHRVLVTGGAGFIGMHTCLRLEADGHHAIAFDNMNTYYDVALKESRIKKLMDHNITVFRADVCDANALTTVLNNHRIDRVVHLAAQAGVRYSINHPHKYVQNNINCFVTLLETIKMRSIKLIYASSSSVYGKNNKVPFAEGDRVDHPASLYAATKRSNELIAETYYNLYSQPSIGLRFFTVYGPWGRPDMAYWSFTRNIIDGNPIRMFNHGNLERDFTYIDDVVDGIVASLEVDSSKPLILNLGSHRPVALKHFIQIVEKAVGRRAMIKSVPMQAGDVPRTYADLTQSKKLLNYSPKTSLEVGIPLFVDWYNNYTARR